MNITELYPQMAATWPEGKTVSNIAKALLKARRAFGPVLKSNTNPAFRSKYADLGACLDAIDGACLEAGLYLYQETFEDSTGVTVETVFLHESGETLRCGKLHVPASKQDPQGYGSALTYARRYSLLTACGIAPEDDDGNAASKPAIRHSPVEPIGVSPKRMTLIADTAEAIKERFQATDTVGAYELASEWTDAEERQALWKLLPSNIRSAIKAHAETLKVAA